MHWHAVQLIISRSFIPEGTQARIHFYSVHRDPKNFSYPDEFWPDRWLIAEGIQESNEKIVHNPDAFIPFSFGPANCVGKNLAMKELKMVFTHLLQQADFEFAEGYDPSSWDDEVEEYFTMDIGKLPVVVTPRHHAKAS